MGCAWRYGAPKAFSDFDQNYQAIVPTSQAGTAGRYTVNEGDTLQSIANAVWGDANLWYLLAEANGLTNEDILVRGQSVSISDRSALSERGEVRTSFLHSRFSMGRAHDNHGDNRPRRHRRRDHWSALRSRVQCQRALSLGQKACEQVPPSSGENPRGQRQSASPR